MVAVPKAAAYVRGEMAHKGRACPSPWSGLIRPFSTEENVCLGRRAPEWPYICQLTQDTHTERERERERCGDAPRGNAFRDPGDPTRVRPVLLLLCINSSCRRLQENVFLLFRHNLADCGVKRNKKTCSRHPLTRIKVAPRRREGVVSLVTFCKENAGQYPQQNFGIGANILHYVQMIGTGVQACRAASPHAACTKEARRVYVTRTHSRRC